MNEVILHEEVAFLRYGEVYLKIRMFSTNQMVSRERRVSILTHGKILGLAEYETGSGKTNPRVDLLYQDQLSDYYYEKMSKEEVIEYLL